MSISNKKPSPRYIISIQGTRLDLRLIILPFITLALISLSIFFLWTGDILFIDNIVDLIYKIFPYPRASDISSLIYNTLLFLSTLLYIYMLILGIINAILIIPLVILGFTLPNKTQSEKNIKYDERSGDKNGSVPKEIQVWNWGATYSSYIWAGSYGLWSIWWSVLLMPIPIINILILVVFGLQGNKWAWKAQKWESVEKFIESQNKWSTNPLALFFFIDLVIFLLLINWGLVGYTYNIINPILP